MKAFFINFFIKFSPLIFGEDGKVSISRFWVTTIMIHSCYVWFILDKDIQPMAFQVLILLLGYMFSSKAVYSGKDSFNKWVSMKETSAVQKYKVDSSKAAKNIDGDIG